MSNAAKTTKTAVHDCECSLWEFNLEIDNDGDEYNTGCTAQTVRVFAQGHDAKLVGFMVRAEWAGHNITKTEGGMLSTWGSAKDAAATISEALGAKAAAQDAAARARVAKKAIKRLVAPITKAEVAEAVEAVAAVAEDTEYEATIKVGRWTYTATIDAQGDAHYYSPSKGDVTLVAGSYKKVGQLHIS